MSMFALQRTAATGVLVAHFCPSPWHSDRSTLGAPHRLWSRNALQVGLSTNKNEHTPSQRITSGKDHTITHSIHAGDCLLYPREECFSASPADCLCPWLFMRSLLRTCSALELPSGSHVSADPEGMLTAISSLPTRQLLRKCIILISTVLLSATFSFALSLELGQQHQGLLWGPNGVSVGRQVPQGGGLSASEIFLEIRRSPLRVPRHRVLDGGGTWAPKAPLKMLPVSAGEVPVSAKAPRPGKFPEEWTLLLGHPA